MESIKKILSSPKKRSETLKIIAIISMVVDHIGFGFFPAVPIFRIIGRIAMPVFAFGIAEGYRHTSDLKKYITRLFIFGLVAQIPFMLFVSQSEFNILFSFVFSLYFIYFIDKKNYAWAGLVFVLSAIIPIEYGVYGILTSFIFYRFRGQDIKILLSQSALLLVNFVFSLVFVQLFALLGILAALYFPKERFKMHLPKQFFYWFYPAHLLILFIIKIILEKNA